MSASQTLFAEKLVVKEGKENWQRKGLKKDKKKKDLKKRGDKPPFLNYVSTPNETKKTMPTGNICYTGGCNKPILGNESFSENVYS